MGKNIGIRITVYALFIALTTCLTPIGPRNAMAEGPAPQRYCGGDKYSECLQLALKNDYGAQYSLGMLHYFGHSNFEQDYTKAKHFFRLAGSQGHINSMWKLAEIHYYGLGQSQNLERAYIWYAMLASSLSPSQERRIAILNRLMISNQMGEAELARTKEKYQEFKENTINGAD